MMAMLRSLLFLLMMFFMGNAEVGKCPYGWTNFGVRCYKYFPGPVKWITAEKNCQSLGANLASVHSKPEDDFLLSLMPASSLCWVGGHDGAEEGQWMWSDGSVHDYTNWCAGQPDNFHGSENCADINWSDGRCWNDAGCPAEICYICAKDL